MAFDFKTHPFTSKLQNVKQSGINKWLASCPCTANHKNKDKKRSLSVCFDPQTENLLINCFTGCSASEIVSSVNCTLADLFTGERNTKKNSLMQTVNWYANKNSFRLSDIYPYGDGLFKVKFYDSEGEKTFRWIHKDPAEVSGFSWTHKGFSPRLYVSGNLEDQQIILTEGEKDANTVNLLTGLTAVSAENGATARGDAGSKWHEEYTAQLSGKDVLILWDNDAAGKYFAKIEAERILSAANSVKLLDLLSVWPDCSDGGDISDFAGQVGNEEAIEKFFQMVSKAEQIYSVDDAEKLINANSTQVPGAKVITTPGASATQQNKPGKTPEEIPPLETFDADFFNNTDIPEPKPIIDKILFSGLGILGSPAKMGKSYMMLQLAVAVATGESFLGFDVKRPGSVLYLDLQGTKARTKKRLESMGYQSMPKGITLAYRARTTDDGFTQQIEQWLSSADNPSLVIVDMMEQIKGSQRRTEDAYRSDNRILGSLHDIAIKHDISVFGVMHTRKGYAKLKPDDPFNEIIGSVAQFGSADCAWMILGKRDDDKKQLSVICRDYDEGQQDFEAVFTDHRWSVSGTVEEIEEQKAANRYENDPSVFTIRTLIKESGGRWSGTMTDLIQEIATRTGEYPASSPKKMSILVSGIAYRLSCEGIEIEYPDHNGGRKGRVYTFSRRIPKQLEADI